MLTAAARPKRRLPCTNWQRPMRAACPVRSTVRCRNGWWHRQTGDLSSSYKIDGLAVICGRSISSYQKTAEEALYIGGECHRASIRGLSAHPLTSNWPPRETRYEQSQPGFRQHDTRDSGSDCPALPACLLVGGTSG